MAHARSEGRMILQVNRRFIAIATIAALSVGLWLYMNGDKNYEECIAREMKSLDVSVYSTVHRLCSKRFARDEVIFPLNYDVSWSSPFPPILRVVITQRSGSEEYLVKKGTFAFSPYDCEKSKEADFTIALTEEADEDGNFQFVPKSTEKGMILPVCMKTISLVGRYK